MDIADCILINGLEFYGYHGASDQEQTIGHRYLLDVCLFVDTRPAGKSDRLNDTVNYSRVSRRLVEIGTQEQFRLLEALAARLAEIILEEFVIVQAIRLRVQKMCPPMNAIAASVGVEITRRRTDQGQEIAATP